MLEEVTAETFPSDEQCQQASGYTLTKSRQLGGASVLLPWQSSSVVWGLALLYFVLFWEWLKLLLLLWF